MVLERSEVAGHGWDGHLLLLHGSEAERESGLVSWVRRGLANNEKVIYSDATAGPGARSVAAILGRHGIDVAGLRAEGRLAALPLPQFYPLGAMGPAASCTWSSGRSPRGTARPGSPARPWLR